MATDANTSLNLDKDRNSDPALETRIKDGVADLKQIKELNEEKRKSAKRKEFIMAELLETERSYVKVTLRIFFYFSKWKITKQKSIVKEKYICCLLKLKYQ